MPLPKRKMCYLVSSGLLLICLAALSGWFYGDRARLLAAADAAEGQNQSQAGSKEKLRVLLLERYDILKRFAESYQELLKSGRVEWSDVANATVAMFHAEADLCLTDAERIKVYEKLVETLRGFEESLAREAAAARRPTVEVDKVKVARLEAQIRLEQLRLGSGTKERTEDTSEGTDGAVEQTLRLSAPVVAESPAVASVGTAHVKVDYLVIEVWPAAKMDRETTIAIENLLGLNHPVVVESQKRPLGSDSSNSVAGNVLRQAVEATAKVQGDRAGEKRVTQQQFKALIELLASRGFVRILMNPTLEVVEGKTARIKTDQNALEVGVRAIKDDSIDLQVQADLGSERSFSTRVRVNPGQSLIIGGTTRPGLRTAPASDAEGSQPPAKELMCIITASIATPATDAKALSGRVVDAAGNPVAAAQVGLSTETIGVLVSHGKLEPMRGDAAESRIVQTDSQGAFVLGERPTASFDLIVAHDKGFASVGSGAFHDSNEIRLQPWGRIEGQIARVPGAGGRKVCMSGLPNPTWFLHKGDYRYETQCDTDGRFVFERVPAGWFEAGYLIRVGDSFWSVTCRTPVEVKPGQTAHVTLGGSGRPVVGKFEPPEGYDKSIFFGNGLRSLITTRPDEPRPENYDRMTRREQEQWRVRWRKSREYGQYRDSYWRDPNWRQYTFRINNDGSFQIEDVIAGKYELTVWIEEPLTAQGRGAEIGGYRGMVEVPQMPGGRSDEPLDLGQFELTMHEPDQPKL